MQEDETDRESQSNNLIRYLDEYHDACPKTKIVLAGYSAGAVITMNVLCGASSNGWRTPAEALASKWADTSESSATSRLPTTGSPRALATDVQTVLGTVVYGDETFTPHQEYNKGTCWYTSRFPRKNPAGCDDFAEGIHAYCDMGDPECCDGNDPAAHFEYFSRYDEQAAQFIKSRWDALQ